VDYEPDAEAIARAYAPPLLAPVFVPATAEGLEVARRLIAEMDRITAAARVVRVDTDDWAPWVAARAAESRSELGLEVQRRRLEAGWTCRRLAAELGVAASTVSRVERGEMGPADAAVALAAWLGWTPEEVLLGATAPERER
jgi:DNA-binding XRE family transcriptional regulator